MPHHFYLTTKYLRNTKCEGILTRYAAYPQNCLELRSPEGIQLMRVSVCLSSEGDKQGPDEIYIKNWSENEGVFEALCEIGVLEDTGEKIKTGYVYANVGRITPFGRQIFTQLVQV